MPEIKNVVKAKTTADYLATAKTIKLEVAVPTDDKKAKVDAVVFMKPSSTGWRSGSQGARMKEESILAMDANPAMYAKMYPNSRYFNLSDKQKEALDKLTIEDLK